MHPKKLLSQNGSNYIQLITTTSQKELPMTTRQLIKNVCEWPAVSEVDNPERHTDKLESKSMD